MNYFDNTEEQNVFGDGDARDRLMAKLGLRWYPPQTMSATYSYGGYLGGFSPVISSTRRFRRPFIQFANVTDSGRGDQVSGTSTAIRLSMASITNSTSSSYSRFSALSKDQKKAIGDGLVHTIFDSSTTTSERVLETKDLPPLNIPYKLVNPVHVLREALTDTTWGQGVPPERLDDANWKKAAETVYNEGWAFAILEEDQTSIDDFIKRYSDEINAVIDEDDDTGLIVINLIRKDYDINAIPRYDESNTVAVRRFTRPAPEALKNTIKADFWDVQKGSKSSLTLSGLDV